MTLIHCAMLSEAIYIIEKYKLKLIQKNPKIYSNETTVLCVSGIGEQNTIQNLKIIYEKYDISKAINIGIAGCSDKSVDIGKLFCTTHKLKYIKYMLVQTVNTPQIQKVKESYLYDMEAKYFYESSLEYVNKKDIYIYKVVSDYLEDNIISKEFVKQLIKKAIYKYKLNF